MQQPLGIRIALENRSVNLSVQTPPIILVLRITLLCLLGNLGLSDMINLIGRRTAEQGSINQKDTADALELQKQALNQTKT